MSAKWRAAKALFNTGWRVTRRTADGCGDEFDEDEKGRLLNYDSEPAAQQRADQLNKESK